MVKLLYDTEAPTVDMNPDELEQRRMDPALFKLEISHADGTLIPLAKKTIDDKRLFISATHVKNPTLEEDARANPEFWAWRQDGDAKPHSGVVLIDVYAEGTESEDRDEAKIPIGHMDWWLMGDFANGGGNMHGAVIPKDAHELASVERWENLRSREVTAFKVDPDYQRQGIGSFMLAASAVTLPFVGVSKFYSGGLLEPAKSTYARFGLTPKDFANGPVGGGIPIERLALSPQVDKSIAEFL